MDGGIDEGMNGQYDDDDDELVRNASPLSSEVVTSVCVSADGWRCIH